MELQRALPDFQRHGVSLFAISYDPVATLAAFAETHGITYPLLSDEGSRVIRELGLFNEQVHEHHALNGIPKRAFVWGVPYPGSFRLDAAGMVVEKRFDASYRERETGFGILERGFGLEGAVLGPSDEASAPGVHVHAYLDSDVYRSMQRLTLTVELLIEPGLHVQGTSVPAGYVPLAVEVAPLEAVAVGSLEMPPTHPFRVAGLDDVLHVHEGRLRCTRTLTFWAKQPDRTLDLTVRFQACSATDCLTPQAITLHLPLRAANHVDSER